MTTLNTLKRLAGMITESYDPTDETHGESQEQWAMVDWKASPHDVLEEINKLLASHGLAIKTDEQDQSDGYVFCIVKKTEGDVTEAAPAAPGGNVTFALEDGEGDTFYIVATPDVAEDLLATFNDMEGEMGGAYGPGGNDSWQRVDTPMPDLKPVDAKMLRQIKAYCAKHGSEGYSSDLLGKLRKSGFVKIG